MTSLTLLLAAEHGFTGLRDYFYTLTPLGC
jgi:hypothetical protein